MKYEELRAQYPHPQPYSGVALPQLGLGWGGRGQSHAPATQGDPIVAPKQPKIRLKQVFLFPPNSQICE